MLNEKYFTNVTKKLISKNWPSYFFLTKKSLSMLPHCLNYVCNMAPSVIFGTPLTP